VGVAFGSMARGVAGGPAQVADRFRTRRERTHPGTSTHLHGIAQFLTVRIARIHGGGLSLRYRYHAGIRLRTSEYFQ